jgi:hypothetical protein
MAATNEAIAVNPTNIRLCYPISKRQQTERTTSYEQAAKRDERPRLSRHIRRQKEGPRSVPDRFPGIVMLQRA